MTEEIKEILSIVSEGQDSIQRQQLVNYITNLQKEKDNYKQRNEKAIEWCKCVINSKTTVGILPNGKRTDMGYCLDLAEPLLNILKGGDE